MLLIILITLFVVLMVFSEFGSRLFSYKKLSTNKVAQPLTCNSPNEIPPDSKMHTCNTTETLSNIGKNIVFFEPVDIFVNRNNKLTPRVIHSLNPDDQIDIINYTGENITFYTY